MKVHKLNYALKKFKNFNYFILLLLFSSYSYAQTEDCSPFSPLPCDRLEKTLPYQLDFLDGKGELANTGFTMVLPPSVNQFPNPPSYPDVPGYEPSLLSISNGRLVITSTKGIAAQKPPTSTNNNTQVNALGIGVSPQSNSFDISTRLLQPDFMSSSGNNWQQGGLWYGIGEDNYVKLVLLKVGTDAQRVQLLVEKINPDDPSKVIITELNTTNFSISQLNGQSIKLRLEVNPISNQVKGYYQIGEGVEVQVTQNGQDVLNIPQSFLVGIDHDADANTTPLNFAGIFTTHRNAALDQSINFEFENFNIISHTTQDEHTAYFSNPTPSNGAVGVALSGFQITVSITLPEGFELDKSTLDGNVNLYEITASGSHILVPSNYNDTGGGDAITLTPQNTLKPLTNYMLKIEGVEANLIGDLTIRTNFQPFQTSFITAQSTNSGSSGLENVSFTQVWGNALSNSNEIYDRFTSLVIGPDGKLYASTLGEVIKRWTIAPDGTLTNPEALQINLVGSPAPVGTSVRTANNDNRLIIGLTFDPASTADNLIAYVSHSELSLTDGPAWDGKITKLSGANLENIQDLIIHLPRSLKDHLTNSLAFGQDGKLYISQGSNTAGGYPDPLWGNRPERLLAGTILALDLSKLQMVGLPMSAFTTDNLQVINNAPATGTQMSDGTYNPYSADSPLTIYAAGVRNAYDLVWHSNGWLYLPTNGTAGNNSTSPVTPSSTQYLQAANNFQIRRPDGTFYNHNDFPIIPSIVGGNTQKDWLFKASQGSYHGHPNPLQGYFVLNHGGITYSGIPGQTNAHKDVTKYSNSVLPDPAYTGIIYDFGFNKSPNGAVEYTSDAFDGALKGKLLVTRFSGQDDVIALEFDQNGDVLAAYDNIQGLQGFDDPLDIVEDPRTGNLYLAQYDRGSNKDHQLVLLRANTTSALPQLTLSAEEFIFETTNNTQGSQSITYQLTVSNTGTSPLVISNVSLSNTLSGMLGFTGPTQTTIAPNASVNYSITFTSSGSSTGYLSSNLVFTSNDAASPVTNLGLHILKKVGFEGMREPALQDVVNALGYDTEVGWSGLTMLPYPFNGSDEAFANGLINMSPEMYGDEVSVQTFKKAGNQMVELIPIARYSPAEELPSGWYINNDGTPNLNQLFVLSNGYGQHQTLFPQMKSGGTREFDPQEAEFGIYMSSQYFKRNSYTEDTLNVPSTPPSYAPGTGSRHRVRTYPLKNRQGVPIPNQYILCFEDANNGDYQDYMYVLKNVRPANEPLQEVLALMLNPNQLTFELKEGEISLPKFATISATVTPTTEILLTSNQDWVIIPNSINSNESFEIRVDASTLSTGIYQALITATTEDYEEASLSITIEVKPREEQPLETIALSWINTNTNTVIQPLVQGSTLNITDFDPSTLSVIAVNNGLPASSLVFSLNGPLSSNRTENVAPYLLFGDNAGNYFAPPSPFQVGDYTLTASAYTQTQGNGELIATTTVSFTLVEETETPCETIELSVVQTSQPTCEGNDGKISVATSIENTSINYVWSHDPQLNTAQANDLTEGTYQVYAVNSGNGCRSDIIEVTLQAPQDCEPILSPAVIELSWVDTEANTLIQTLQEGSTLNLTTFDASKLSIIATNQGVPAGSLIFHLHGPILNTRIENVAPYLLFGDNAGNYFAPPSPFQVGNYTVTVSAYSQTQGKGELLASTTINFSIIDEEEVDCSGLSIALVNTNEPTCANNDGVITLATSYDSIDLRYVWAHDMQLESNQAENLSAGIYQIHVIDLSNNCISSSIEVALTLPKGCESAPDLSDAYYINVGGSEITWNGQTYQSDTHFVNGRAINTNRNASVLPSQSMYQTARVSGNDNGFFEYAIPLNQAGEYQVTLHFAETWWNTSTSNLRVFDVLAEGDTLLKHFDIAEASNGLGYVSKTFYINSDGVLDLRFSAENGINQPILSAIEISDVIVAQARVSTNVPTTPTLAEIDINQVQVIGLYPNPVTDNYLLNIAFDKVLNEVITYQIYDNTGRLLFSKNEMIKGKVMTLNLQEVKLINGSYTLLLEGEKLIQKRLKFIKTE